MVKPGTSATKSQDLDELGALLQHIKATRGFDFTGYKRSTLERRIAARIAAVEVEGYLAYLDYLEVHPDELPRLFDTLLINVTSFFRDPPAWDYLATEIVPRLLERRPQGSPLRVWSAGCASGEEAYTAATVLAEAIGEAAFLRRVKIYATDVDEAALTTARHGSYTAKQVDGLPQPLLERYFERIDQRFHFRKDLRRALIFGRNDLMHDAPISRIDLLICRNTLMYFNAETQGQILRRFSFALNPDGFLFLGRSEMLITHADLFTAVNIKRRVFSKVAKPTLRDRLLHAAGAVDDALEETGTAIRERSFDASPTAQVVVDAQGTVALVNRHARELFGLSAEDINRPLRDVGLSYRPVELRPAIDHAVRERHTVRLGPVSWTSTSGEGIELQVEVTPLVAGDMLLGTSVAYTDVTPERRLHEELQRSRGELEAAYSELHSTVEEIETTNEELQSTNEELETTNEELQSTNEELETMNEELRSSNDELETMNDELRHRTSELDEVNGFLEMIVTSFGVAVVVLDRDGLVQVWNPLCEELWGLRAEEVLGTRFLDLDIGLPVAELAESIDRALVDETSRDELTVSATTRRGRTIECRVRTVPLALNDANVSGVILLMDQADGAAG